MIRTGLVCIVFGDKKDKATSAVVAALTDFGHVGTVIWEDPRNYRNLSEINEQQGGKDSPITVWASLSAYYFLEEIASQRPLTIFCLPQRNETFGLGIEKASKVSPDETTWHIFTKCTPKQAAIHTEKKASAAEHFLVLGGTSYDFPQLHQYVKR